MVWQPGPLSFSGLGESRMWRREQYVETQPGTQQAFQHARSYASKGCRAVRWTAMEVAAGNCGANPFSLPWTVPGKSLLFTWHLHQGRASGPGLEKAWTSNLLLQEGFRKPSLWSLFILSYLISFCRALQTTLDLCSPGPLNDYCPHACAPGLWCRNVPSQNINMEEQVG